jgi:hypothetical protein
MRKNSEFPRGCGILSDINHISGHFVSVMNGVICFRPDKASYCFNRFNRFNRRKKNAIPHPNQAFTSKGQMVFEFLR